MANNFNRIKISKDSPFGKLPPNSVMFTLLVEIEGELKGETANKINKLCCGEVFDGLGRSCMIAHYKYDKEPGLYVVAIGVANESAEYFLHNPKKFANCYSKIVNQISRLWSVEEPGKYVVLHEGAFKQLNDKYIPSKNVLTLDRFIELKRGANKDKKCELIFDTLEPVCVQTPGLLDPFVGVALMNLAVGAVETFLKEECYPAISFIEPERCLWEINVHIHKKGKYSEEDRLNCFWKVMRGIASIWSDAYPGLYVVISSYLHDKWPAKDANNIISRRTLELMTRGTDNG